MTLKVLVGILTLILCAIVLMSPETAETRQPPTVHSHAADPMSLYFLQRGNKHLAVGDFAEAIADFDTALQIDPEHPEAYYYRASAKFELGKSEQGQGKVEQAKSTYRSAIEDYAKVITLNPEHPDAYIFGGSVHLRLGSLAENEGNWEQAKHHFQAVNKMGRHLTDVDPENASGWRTRGVATLKLGVLAAHKGKSEQAQRYYDDSLEAYNHTIALDPENPAAYASRADMYIYLGVWEMTKTNFQQAKHHYQSAIQDARQATLMAPTMRYALFFSVKLNAAYIKLGDAEGALGNVQEAQSHYQLAIESLGAITFLGQQSIAAEGAYTYLAEGKLKLGDSETLTGNVQQAEQHYREAIADSSQLIALVPQKVEAFYTRGRAKAALSDYTGAIADFERVIVIKSYHALAYYAQGLAKQALGEHDAAAFDFAKARTLNPEVEKLYPFSSGGEE